MTEKLCERLEMQEDSSSLLASTSACFILPSRFVPPCMLLWISETAKCSFREAAYSGVRNTAGYSIMLFLILHLVIYIYTYV